MYEIWICQGCGHENGEEQENCQECGLSHLTEGQKVFKAVEELTGGGFILRDD